MTSWLKTILGIVWACPNTLLGLILGGMGLVTGGQVQRVGRTLEFHGGVVTWLMERVANAMVLGHVILGQSSKSLEHARSHEWVHVRQYERWGPFFLPAYLGCSFWIWLRRNGCPYRDNPFEREAYDADARRHGERNG